MGWLNSRRPDGFEDAGLDHSPDVTGDALPALRLYSFVKITSIVFFTSPDVFCLVDNRFRFS